MNNKTPKNSRSIKFLTNFKIKERPFRFIFGLLLTLIIVAFVSSSYLAKYFITQWFQDQDATVTLNDLKLSFVDSYLEIDGFNTHKDNRHLGIKFLRVDWQWWPLFNNQLIFDDFQLTGLEIDLESQNSQLKHIGPLAITNDSNGNQKDNTSQPQATWTINHSNVFIDIQRICLHGEQLLDSEQEKLLFVQSTGQSSDNSQLNDLKTLNSPFCIRSQMSFDGKGTLTLSEAFNIAIAGDVSVEKSQLEMGNHPIYQHESLHLKSFKYQSNEIQAAQLSLQNVQLGSKTPISNVTQNLITNYSAHLGELELNTIDIALDEQTVDVNTFNLKDLHLNRYFTDQFDTLFQLGNLTLTNFFHQPDITSLESIFLKNVSALANKNARSSHTKNYLLGLNETAIEHLKLTPQSLSINTLNLDGVFTHLIIDPKGQPEFNRWLTLPGIDEKARPESSKATDQISKETATKAPESHEKEKQPFNLFIQQMELSNSQNIVISDFSGQQSSTQTLSNLEINIEKFNNLGEVFDTQISAVFNDTGKLQLKGPSLIAPPHFDTSIKGSIEHLNLADFSRYSERFIGYRIDQGVLSSTLDVKIKRSDLNSVIDLNFNKFELGDLEQHEQNPLNSELGVPLPLALNLLRDSDDNINIELPITGNMEAPDFSINDIVTTISVKAIKSAIIYQYSPFGLLTLASGAIDLATGLTFDPITFAETSHTLDSHHFDKLTSIAQLLQKKPRLSIVLCGQSSIEDLAQTTTNNRDEDSQPNTATSKTKISISQPQREQLLSLAKKRQAAVAHYLIHKKSIPAQRIITCNVKLGDIETQDPLVRIKV